MSKNLPSSLKKQKEQRERRLKKLADGANFAPTKAQTKKRRKYNPWVDGKNKKPVDSIADAGMASLWSIKKCKV